MTPSVCDAQFFSNSSKQPPHANQTVYKFSLFKSFHSLLVFFCNSRGNCPMSISFWDHAICSYLIVYTISETHAIRLLSPRYLLPFDRYRVISKDSSALIVQSPIISTCPNYSLATLLGAHCFRASARGVDSSGFDAYGPLIVCFSHSMRKSYANT